MSPEFGRPWAGEEEKARRAPVLLCVQNTSYTGSWWLFSMTEVSNGVEPDLRRSKKLTRPLYEPPMSESGFLGLKRRQHSGEAAEAAGGRMRHTRGRTAKAGYAARADRE